MPQIAHKLDDAIRTNDIKTDENADFTVLHLSPDVLRGLRESGFEKPSPIQLSAIPIGRIGTDLIAQAKSGTGKTCVFSVIVLEAIKASIPMCQSIIMAPTREIATQIHSVISTVGMHIENLRCCLLIGGTSVSDDKSRIASCQIVIGTPGRLLHLIEDETLNIDCIRVLVLDEADKLVDDSFYSQVKSIVNQLPRSKQIIAISATFDKCIDERFNEMMRKPYYIRLSADDMGLYGIRHFYFTVKTDKVKHQMFCNKIQRLLEILSNVPFEQCLIFSNYISGAEQISEELTKNGFSNQVICGNMRQDQRSETMLEFKECKYRVLISTDVTARGIDNQHVDLVINLDLPINSEGISDPHTYLHRSGRAGRYGKYGAAISIVCSQVERDFLTELETNYKVVMERGGNYEVIRDILSKVPTLVDTPECPEDLNRKARGSDDFETLRSSVKIVPKSQSSVPEAGTVPTVDEASALTSLGSLGKRLSSTTEDDCSVFNFSRKDVDSYQDMGFLDCLPCLDEDGAVECPSSVSPGNLSTCSSKLTDAEGESLRGRRGSKKEKKPRKPPKSLNMNGRRMGSTPGISDTPIMSPHTPKWRSDAVASSGCLIHSKAINVAFLLQNYLCLQYTEGDKVYQDEHRGLYPTKEDILENSSTPLCMRDEKVEKKALSRYVSHGFITTPPLPPPSDTKEVLCSRCKSVVDDEDILEVGDEGKKRPGNIPEFHREQSKDSGVFSYSSPYFYPRQCWGAAPTPPPTYHHYHPSYPPYCPGNVPSPYYYDPRWPPHPPPPRQPHHYPPPPHLHPHQPRHPYHDHSFYGSHDNTRCYSSHDNSNHGDFDDGIMFGSSDSTRSDVFNSFGHSNDNWKNAWEKAYYDA